MNNLTQNTLNSLDRSASSIEARIAALQLQLQQIKMKESHPQAGALCCSCDVCRPDLYRMFTDIAGLSDVVPPGTSGSYSGPRPKYFVQSTPPGTSLDESKFPYLMRSANANDPKPSILSSIRQGFGALYSLFGGKP